MKVQINEITSPKGAIYTALGMRLKWQNKLWNVF